MKRLEIKFDVTNYSDQSIIEMFKLNKIYQYRKIFSTYYDTKNLNFFYSSIEGLRPRTKVRIRNYDNEDKYFLEFKYSTIHGKKKKTFLLENFLKKNKLNINTLKYIRQYLRFRIDPKLTVSYFRRYYINRIGRFTLDTNIKFNKGIDEKRKNFIIGSDKKILEFKRNDISMEKQFTKNFILKEHSFSKYCEGINALYKLNY